MIQQLNITEGDTKFIIGRTCRDFRIYVDYPFKFYQGFSDTYYWLNNDKKFSSRFDICIDEQTGLILQLKVYLKPDSEPNRAFLEVNMTSFNNTVADSEFVLGAPFHLVEPFAIMSHVLDGGNRMYVTMFLFADYNGTLIVNSSIYNRWQGEYATIQADLKKFNITTLEIIIPSNKIQFLVPPVDIEICENNNCVANGFPRDHCANSMSVLPVSEETCLARPECMYKEGICQKFNCRSLIKTECGGSESCYWDQDSYSLIGVCTEKDCSEFNSYESCKRNMCLWSNNTCTYFACFEIENETSCNVDYYNRCAWNYKKQSCTENAQY